MIFTSFSAETRAIFAALPDEGRSTSLKRILIPVDFSPCSENAIRYGLAVAMQAGAEVVLLHGVNVPLQNPDFIANPLTQMEDDARARLEETATEIAGWLDREDFPTIPVSIQVRVGFTGELILDMIGSLEADLVIMGTQGTGRIEGFLLGSNTTHIIEKAPCPVLAVPEEANFDGIRKVVLATDLEPLEPKLVKKLTDFAGLFGAAIDVLNIFTPGSSYSPSQVQVFKDDLRRKVNYEQLAFHIYETILDDLTEALQDYLDANDADLVVMQTHHRSFLQKLFHPSKTKRMALHTHTPLLALHAGPR